MNPLHCLVYVCTCRRSFFFFIIYLSIWCPLAVFIVYQIHMSTQSKAQLITIYNICSFSRPIVRMQLCRWIIHEEHLKDTQLQDNLFKHNTAYKLTNDLDLAKRIYEDSNTVIVNWFLHALYLKNLKHQSKINKLLLDRTIFFLIHCCTSSKSNALPVKKEMVLLALKRA